MTYQTLDEPEVLELGPREPEPAATSRGARPGPAVLSPQSPAPTYVGIGVTILGFVLIVVAWGQVAGQTNVALQMPYLLSGGLIGLALVLVGLTVISVAAKRRDAALREQQTLLLADALNELRVALEGDGRR